MCKSWLWDDLSGGGKGQAMGEAMWWEESGGGRSKDYCLFCSICRGEEVLRGWPGMGEHHWKVDGC